ncbi:hypothetical protein AB0O74_16110 [Streptomyces rubiginosohelvolus]|uniref:hypothetical protein n=1 Tax=Streptomyces rubiginosohelvolus TaxID=67362 RepID=UPI0034230562
MSLASYDLIQFRKSVNFLFGANPSLRARSQVRSSCYYFHLRKTIPKQIFLIIPITLLADYAARSFGPYEVIANSVASALTAGAEDGQKVISTGAMLTIGAAYIYAYWAWFQSTHNRSPLIGMRRNHKPDADITLYLASCLVVWCSNVGRGSYREREMAVRQVDAYARLLGRALMRVSNDNNLSVTSQRRKAANRHGRLVAALLRQKIQAIDTNPVGISLEIAGISTLLCENYSRARLGALVDSEYLTDVTPAKDHEWARLALAATLTTGAAIGIGFAGLPDAVAPIALGSIALLIFTGALGGSSPRALELLDSMRGVQRP